jgi:hypothetical protein
MKAHPIQGAFYLFVFSAVSMILVVLSAQHARAQSCTGWSAGPDMPSTGVRMVGVYFPANGRFYVVGGRSMDGVGNDFAHL